MWSVRTESLAQFRGLRFRFDHASSLVTWAEVLRSWQREESFRTWFTTVLATTPYTAFRWETPGLTTTTLAQPFECVVLDSPGLDRPPDLSAFAEHFTAPEKNVIAFSNLGGDAILIVPCPLGEASTYVHLASFLRKAPEQQRHALWQQVGEAMSRRVSTKTVWLSTAGAGVAWLHVRLDDRPKYYGFGEYRTRVK